MDQFCFGHYDMTTSQKIKIIGYFFIVWPMDNCIKFSGQKSKKSALGFKGLTITIVLDITSSLDNNHSGVFLEKD